MRNLMDIFSNSFSDTYDEDIGESGGQWTYTKTADGVYEVTVEDWDDETASYAVTDRFRVSIEPL